MHDQHTPQICQGHGGEQPGRQQALPESKDSDESYLAVQNIVFAMEKWALITYCDGRGDHGDIRCALRAPPQAAEGGSGIWPGSVS